MLRRGKESASSISSLFASGVEPILTESRTRNKRLSGIRAQGKGGLYEDEGGLPMMRID